MCTDHQNFPGYNQRTWLQQDGATPHTSKTSLLRVREIFPGKLISRRGDINWPPRSPDLAPMDVFLWGYLKPKVYANKPTFLAHLKENIRHQMADITGPSRHKKCSYSIKWVPRTRGFTLGRYYFEEINSQSVYFNNE